MKAFVFLAPLAAVALSAATPNAQGLSLHGDKECRPTDLGNGVWYFKTCTGGFGKNLSDFKAANPDLIVMAIGPIVSQGGSGAYYVSTERRR